jgi:hypothetical protein
MSEQQIKAVIDGSEYADSQDFQDPERSYMHAMTGTNLVAKFKGDIDTAKAASQN